MEKNTKVKAAQIHYYPLEEPNIIVKHRFVYFQVSGMHPWLNQ